MSHFLLGCNRPCLDYDWGESLAQFAVGSKKSSHFVVVLQSNICQIQV